MKKIISFFLALVLTFSGLVPIYASGQYEEAGNILKDLGLLSGNEKGDLMLESNLRRQDMVIMIARLYNQLDTAKSFTGPNKFKDLGRNQEFYIRPIAWANSKGLVSGYPDGNFGFNRDITVQEYQSVLLRALGYTVNWKDVPDSAEDKHVMDGLSLNDSANLTRGQMAVMTVNALRQLKNNQNITLAQELGVTIPDQFKVDANVKVENDTLLFEGQAKGTDFLMLNLKPAPSNTTFTEKFINISTDLEGNFTYRINSLPVGNYLYRFQSGLNYTSFKSVSIEVLPFNLVEVKATNLKEITLKFTQPIDKATTSLINNYNTTAGSIKNVRFEENDTKIILTLTGIMTQQMKYKISALKMKSATGIEIPLKDYEFDAFDNQIPNIISVKQLGTKGLKIYFSEPIRNGSSANFKVDGKSFPGNVKFEYNTATLLYYSSYYAISEGNHTLTVLGLEDYAGYKAIDENRTFTIIKDITPPSVKSASATLEEVIIEFDEDIDPISALNNNFYWKQGAIKRYSNKVTIEGNKAKVEFLNNILSNGENIIYIENIVDYSNNKIKSTEVKVIPVIDMTSPEVVNYTISEDGKTITVYYSKNVIGNLRTSYSIIDKNNRPVSIRDIQGSGREFRINLYTSLPVGLNIFTIQGIQDTTPLKNILTPFSTSIDMKDIEKPRILNHTGFANHIIIHFSKPMDMTTVSNPDNYIMTFGGKQYRLPNNTLFTPSNDGKSVTILLPEYFDGKKIMIGTAANLTTLDLIGLKDLSGNDTDPIIVKVTFDATISGKAKAIDYYMDKPGKQGIIVDSKIIKIRFNAPIIQANITDFLIGGRIISNVVADGSDEVTIYLNDIDINYFPISSIIILPNNNLRTSLDTEVEGGTIQLFDEVPTSIRNNTYYLTVYGNQIEIPFNKALEEEGASLYRRDLEIVRLADNKLLSKDDYTTSLKYSDKSILVITINNRSITSGYSVRLSGEFGSGTLSYIRDKDGNLALPSDVYYTGTDIPKQ